MTQFAIFTGEMPTPMGCRVVALESDQLDLLVGDALSDRERKESWVFRADGREVIEDMCCEAMQLAQKLGSIYSTELYSFLSLYIQSAKAITFFYGSDLKDLQMFHDSSDFMQHISDCLSGQCGTSLEIYAQYRASTLLVQRQKGQNKGPVSKKGLA